MKKVKKVVALCLMVGLLFSMQGTTASAAECGSWQVSATGSSYCDTSSGCGFLWLADTQKHNEAQYRLCTSISGSVVTITRETRTVVIKDGCC